MNRIACFFLEPAQKFQRSLQRFAWDKHCSGRYSFHNAAVVIDRVAAVMVPMTNGCYPGEFPSSDLPLGRQDPRWPVKCDSCDYRFVPEDQWQQDQTLIYRRVDTGEEMTINAAPAGAMWYQDSEHFPSGPDGHRLMVRTPGGDWDVDSRASNCTLPDDTEHRCWVRHGDPRQPTTVTVDKNGRTCRAGAGSIIAGSYHGW